MHKVYKIEFKPNQTQIKTINKTFGTCRYLYNKYLVANKVIYREKKNFISGYEFDKLVNHLSKHSDELIWIKDTSSKARKQSIMEAEIAFKRFFKGLSGYPRFKRKNDNQSYYFIKDQVKIKSKKIKVPILGWLKLKEYDYIPEDTNVVSGRIIKEYNKYYVMFITQYEPKPYKKVNNYGFGVDAGVKDYLIFTNGQKIFRFKNINKSNKVKVLEMKIKSLQRIIANKIKINKKKGGTAIYNSRNINKLRIKIRKLYMRLRFIRNDFIKKICSILVKAKPIYITIENLSNKQILIDGNHKLADNWAKCKFGYFKDFLTWKCKQRGIVLRIADKYFASSKTCSSCGNKKKDLTLSDRTYVCKECGLIIDRDENAAINLLNTNKYKLAY